MSSFSAVIAYKFPNEEYQALVLDTITGTSVNGQAQVTNQPMANGEVIGDHMYNEPKTLSLSGTLSLNGSKVTQVSGQGSKLANFQDLIEKIQRNGIKCDIIRLNYDENSENIRFLARPNMAVESFHWTENINSLSFQLEFKEVISVQVEDFNYDSDDEYLCNLTEPVLRSFTDIIIDWNEIDASLLKTLQSEELMTELFWTKLKGAGSDLLKSVVSAVIADLLLGAISTLGFTGLVGGIVIAVAAVYFFARFLYNLIVRTKKEEKYKIKVFDAKNDEEMNASIKRLGSLVEEVHNEFNSLSNIMKIYQVSDNVPQTVMMTIGDENYDFKFTKNNLTGSYSLNTENDSGESGDWPDITTCVESFNNLKQSDRLFTTQNNNDIYLCYIPVTEDDNGNATGREDLRNYFIIVAGFNVDDFNLIVEDIVKSAILKDYNKKWSGWVTL